MKASLIVHIHCAALLLGDVVSSVRSVWLARCQEQETCNVFGLEGKPSNEGPGLLASLVWSFDVGLMLRALEWLMVFVIVDCSTRERYSRGVG